VKARGIESDDEVSLAAGMFVLDVSKPRETGVTSKRFVGHNDVSATLQ
jgi:hypothetical protein